MYLRLLTGQDQVTKHPYCFFFHQEYAGVSGSLTGIPVASWVMPLSCPHPAPSKSWVLCASLAWFICVYLPSEQKLGSCREWVCLLGGASTMAKPENWDQECSRKRPLFSSSSLVCLSFLFNRSFPAFLATYRLSQWVGYELRRFAFLPLFCFMWEEI